MSAASKLQINGIFFTIKESFQDRLICFRACRWLDQFLRKLIVVVSLSFRYNTSDIFYFTLQNFIIKTLRIFFDGSFYKYYCVAVF